MRLPRTLFGPQEADSEADSPDTAQHIVDAVMTPKADDLLVEELRLTCERARVIVGSRGGLPKRTVEGLERLGNRDFRLVSREELSWGHVGVAVQGRGPDFWSRLAEVSEVVASEPEIDVAIGAPPGSEQRPIALWHAVLEPLFQRSARRKPDFSWDAELARDLVADWRASLAVDPIPHKTIAPLENIDAPERPVRIDAHTSIRPITDHDLDQLWRLFGGGFSSTGGITLGQLGRWTHVIDTKWECQGSRRSAMRSSAIGS